jgi:hypothetical protein
MISAPQARPAGRLAPRSRLAAPLVRPGARARAVRPVIATAADGGTGAAPAAPAAAPAHGLRAAAPAAPAAAPARGPRAAALVAAAAAAAAALAAPQPAGAAAARALELTLVPPPAAPPVAEWLLGYGVAHVLLPIAVTWVFVAALNHLAHKAESVRGRGGGGHVGAGGGGRQRSSGLPSASAARAPPVPLARARPRPLRARPSPPRSPPPRRRPQLPNPEGVSFADVAPTALRGPAVGALVALLGIRLVGGGWRVWAGRGLWARGAGARQRLRREGLVALLGIRLVGSQGAGGVGLCRASDERVGRRLQGEWLEEGLQRRSRAACPLDIRDASSASKRPANPPRQNAGPQIRNIFSGIDQYVHLYRPNFGWAQETLGALCCVTMGGAGVV